MEDRLEQLKTLLQIDAKTARVNEIELAMQSSDFWSNHEQAGKLAQELAQLKQVIDNFLLASLDPSDPDSLKLIDELEFTALFSGPYDSNNAILSIHAGAGGTEAQDWASILLRILQRFAERKGWQTAVLDQSLGEEAGIKSVTIEINGRQAFGHLKSEAGVHRLVRISPFDADKARHTSFALVEVIPAIEQAGEIEVKPDELKIDVFRSGGHGGQSVNTTDSAVRLTHLPTGLVVTVQNERSQLQNKETAMKILKSRLLVKQLEEQRQQHVELRGDHISAEWGNQIRSYVLHPYQLVKDHRTGAETSNTSAVLNGEIDLFIEAYLRKASNDR